MAPQRFHGWVLLQIGPAKDAEDAVRFCGGVALLLRAAGVDPALLQQQSGDDSAAAVTLDLRHYERVKSAITAANRSGTGVQLVVPEGFLPPQTLAAFR